MSEHKPDARVADAPDIPGYRIVRRLGAGGMAEVFLAVQLSLQRPVALKVLSFEKAVSEEMAERFEREARTIARLDHPHIVGIFDVGRSRAGLLYYAMPFLPNGALGQRDLRGDPRKVLEVLRAVCEALKYAHAHGVVHRDVKPENILFDKTDRPLLTDFGIALSREHDHRVTTQGRTLGSTGYMSPEQARGHDIDGRADLYSLGVLCYEMLTGELPFHGPDALSVAIAHMQDPVPRLPPTQRIWQPLLDRALAKAPEDRFQNAGEMLVALDEIEQALDGRAPAPAAAASVRRFGAGPWIALGGALFAVVLALGLRRDDAPVSATAGDAAGSAAAIPVLDAAAFDRALAEAHDLLRAGQLVEPADANAAGRFIALLEAVPNSAEARAGLDAVIAAMGERAAAAIAAGRGEDAATLYDQTYAVAQWSGITDYEAYAAYERSYAAALHRRVEAALERWDPESLRGLEPAFAQAEMNDKTLAAKRAQLASAPAPGMRLRDADAPLLAFVPAALPEGRLDHAFAVSVFEVTRGEYAAFARATNRGLGKCRDPNPIGLLRQRDWKDPGYDQNDGHPVVCVSAEDARAYAAWLSQRTGARYRLPTRAEWQHLTRGAASGGNVCRMANVLDQAAASRLGLGGPYGCSDGFARTAPVGRFSAGALGVHDLAGNVREWLDDCAGPRGGGCGERFTIGSSFRDGERDPLFGGARARDVDLGAPDLGFRLVRELGSGLPPRADATTD